MWLFSSFAVSSDDKDLKTFAWIYGTFPAAPAGKSRRFCAESNLTLVVYVFATQYDVYPALVAATIVLSLAVTAPLMYVFTLLITISPNSQNESNLMDAINNSQSEVAITLISNHFRN